MDGLEQKSLFFILGESLFRYFGISDPLTSSLNWGWWRVHCPSVAYFTMGFREWMFFSLVWDSLDFRMEESKIQVSLHFLIGVFGSRSLLHPGKFLEGLCSMRELALVAQLATSPESSEIHFDIKS